MPFSGKTFEFLFDNFANNSKVWYNAHKSDYEEYVKAPFRQFVSDITPAMLEIDSEFICDPARISRLYRDARYVRDGTIFRDHIWYIFGRTKEQYHSLPSFWFSLSPAGISCGCGYYCASSESLEAVRRLILENDVDFQKAKSACNSQKFFKLCGNMYKKDRFPNASDEDKQWLNRRDIYIEGKSNDFKLICSDNLYKKIAEHFKKIAPAYNFLLKAEHEREI